MEYKEFTEKTVEDAKTAACVEFGITSDKLDFEVVEEGSSGFLGLGAKDAVIRARIKDESSESAAEVTEPEKKEEKNVQETVKPQPKKESEPKKERKDFSESKENRHSEDDDRDLSGIDGNKVKEDAEKFIKDVVKAMNMEVELKSEYDEKEGELSVELSGADMGVLIGKRGQTLDSLQYLTSLVINKNTSAYIRVKLDTEDYRRRRKETLENLARNIAAKVKRTKRTHSLEPMNPYERRVIHSALQNDKYVYTHSEGEEPYRKVVVKPKRYN